MDIAGKSAAQRRARLIYEAVARIPPGCVASYGDIARLAGLPGAARAVGRALAHCSDDVPWHRVLNAAGRISLPPGSSAYREQVRRLRREGVEVRDGRVAAGYFQKRAIDIDALLWGPGERRAAQSGRGGRGSR